MEQKSLAERILEEFPEFKSPTDIFYCPKDDWKTNGERNKTKVSLFREAIREYKMKIKDYNFKNMIFPYIQNGSFMKTISGKNIIIKAGESHNFWNEGDELKFDGTVLFFNTTFLGGINFYNVSFLGETQFQLVNFGIGVNFEGSNFLGKTTFYSVGFYGSPIFKKVTFSGETIFSNCFFNRLFDHNQATNFSEIKLKENAEIILNKCIKIPGNEDSKEDREVELVFENMSITNQFTFRDMYLGKTSFLGSHISTDKFFNCEFYDDGIKKGFDDELILNNFNASQSVRPKIPKKNYKEMQSVYTKFKTIFEQQKEWQRAGDFFIGEMEMRTKDLEQDLKPFLGKKFLSIDVFKLLELIFLKLYKQTSYYGERFPSTMLIFLGFRFLGAFIIRIITAINTLNENTYGHAILLTFRSMTFQKDDGFADFSMPVKWIVSILFVVGSILIGIMFLAIRRKFKR